MNLRIVRWFVPLALTCALLTAAHTSAQEPTAKHHQYKLIDLGTFGGPQSGVNGEPTLNFINSAGVLVGGADTSTLTPAPGCYNPVNNLDCFVSHAFVWRGNGLDDLGTLPGGYFSFAEAINQRGQIAGVSENGQIDLAFGNPQFHAVLWENGIVRDLGTLGGMSSFASSINDQGQVTGVALNNVPDSLSILGSGDGTTSTQTRGFLWQNGKMHDLGSLGGPDTFAIFLNQRGQVAGMSYTSDIPDPTSGFPPMDPFLWENGNIKDLGNFGGSNPLGLFSGFISGLNDGGQVTGTMTLSGDQTSHAFLWNGEKLSDLGTLGGSFAVSYGLNSVGAVVGISGLPGDNVFHGFLWRNGVMTDLGTVDGDACSTAQNVNSIGQVVGASQASDGMGGCVHPFTHAFLWENGGPSVDLNALIPSNSALQLTDAALINESGEIIGGGNPPGCTNNDACNHAYVLIPCDKNHPDIQGCDYSLIAATPSAQLEPSQNTQLSTPTGTAKLSPGEVMTRVRSMIGSRYRKFAPLRWQ
jgi:probable HAF family extracellular repeat protein